MIEIMPEDVAVYRADGVWQVGIIETVVQTADGDGTFIPRITLSFGGDLRDVTISAARDGSCYICRKADYSAELGKLVGKPFPEFPQLAAAVKACRLSPSLSPSAPASGRR